MRTVLVSLMLIAVTAPAVALAQPPLPSAQSAPASTPSGGPGVVAAVPVTIHAYGIGSVATETQSALMRNLRALRDAEERFYLATGRFAGSGTELKDFEPLAGAKFMLTAGGDWLSIDAKGADGAHYSVQMYRQDSPVLMGKIEMPADVAGL